MLDLDLPHWYTESSTEGHGHLVIDTNLEPWQMKEIISVLAKHNVLQKGIEKQWDERNCLTLRMPGMSKDNREDGMGFEELKAIGKEPKRAVDRIPKVQDILDMFKF